MFSHPLRLLTTIHVFLKVLFIKRWNLHVKEEIMIRVYDNLIFKLHVCNLIMMHKMAFCECYLSNVVVKFPFFMVNTFSKYGCECSLSNMVVKKLTSSFVQPFGPCTQGICANVTFEHKGMASPCKLITSLTSSFFSHFFYYRSLWKFSHLFKIYSLSPWSLRILRYSSNTRIKASQ